MSPGEDYEVKPFLCSFFNESEINFSFVYTIAVYERMA